MIDWLLIVIAIAAVVVLGAAVVYVTQRRRRTHRLRDRFGEEYDRRLMEVGSRRRVESRLADVSDNHDRLDLRDLTSTSRARYLERWQEIQSRFLDQPGHSLDAADLLVADVMRERGYPIDDFDTQADMLALDHPEVMRHFRAAHATHERTRTGLAGTEEVRVAMIQYRSLFEALLSDGAGTPAPEAEPRVPQF